MSFFDFNPFNGFVSGSMDNSDFGIDQTTKTAMDQMSQVILGLLGSLQSNQASVFANMRNSILGSIGKAKSSMVMSLNGNASQKAINAGGSGNQTPDLDGIISTIATTISGAIAASMYGIKTVPEVLDQINITSGAYFNDTIGKMDYMTYRMGEIMNEHLDNGYSVDALNVLFRQGTSEFGSLMGKIENEWAIVTGAAANLAEIMSAGSLGAIIGSVLTIPGDSQQPTQDQIDAAIAQYQLEQNQEIQENMGNLESEIGEELVAGDDAWQADTSAATNAIIGAIAGTSTNLQSQLGNLVNQWLANVGSKYGGTEDGGPVVPDSNGNFPNLLGLLSGGFF